MTSFNYKARDKYGVLASGSMEALDSRAVAAHLGKLGYIPISISAVPSGGIILKIEEWLAAILGRVRPEEIIVFTRQLSAVLEAGVPLMEGMGASAEQIRNKMFRTVVLKVKNDIEGGLTFSDALKKHPGFFSSFIVNMVRAGERAGILGEVLGRISDLLERDLETTGKIKSAVRYPLIVVVTLVLAFLVVIFGVIPKFMEFFSAFEIELPLPTQVLLGIYYVGKNFGLWIVGLIFMGVWAFRRALKTENFRYRFDRFVLSVPIFGPLFTNIYVSRFSRMLSAMQGSGIPILEGLVISANAVDNKVISRVIMDVKNEVAGGRNLSEPMKGSRLFPPLAISMVAIGERAGNLASMLSKVADYFDREADYTIRNLTPLLEPILILGVALLVLLLALGIFLPMWDVVKIYQ